MIEYIIQFLNSYLSLSCYHSDSECGSSRGSQSGCDPGGWIRKAGGQGCLPPGMPAEDSAPCESLV